VGGLPCSSFRCNIHTIQSLRQRPSGGNHASFVDHIGGVLAFAGDAWAWGDTGHKIVCEIAFQLAANDTRAAIRKLIKTDQEFDTFSDSCTFPDHPRKRASEHFVNLPRDSKGLNANECPAGAKCVVTVILNDTEILTSRSERRRDKLIALKFLGHWVGDIHRPLHVSFEDDRGGNNITMSGECSGKMHAAWAAASRTNPIDWRVAEERRARLPELFTRCRRT
jgi:hypothetical protein